MSSWHTIQCSTEVKDFGGQKLQPKKRENSWRKICWAPLSSRTLWGSGMLVFVLTESLFNNRVSSSFLFIALMSDHRWHQLIIWWNCKDCLCNEVTAHSLLRTFKNSLIQESVVGCKIRTMGRRGKTAENSITQIHHPHKYIQILMKKAPVFPPKIKLKEKVTHQIKLGHL